MTERVGDLEPEAITKARFAQYDRDELLLEIRLLEAKIRLVMAALQDARRPRAAEVKP